METVAHDASSRDAISHHRKSNFTLNSKIHCQNSIMRCTNKAVTRLSKAEITMKISLYDPPLSAPIGVCGPGIDPELVRIYDSLRQIQKQAPGVIIQRYGLATDPDAFQADKTVAELLEQDGTECLPLAFVDGELISRRTYPDNELLQRLLHRQGYTVTLGGEKSCRAGCC
jgi:hypothetical protein